MSLQGERHGRRGLSVMETILAATLVSLIMLVIFNLYPTSMLTLRRSEHRIHAASLAQSILDIERSRPFPELLAMLPAAVRPPNRPSTPPPAMPEAQPRTGSDGVTMTPSVEVFLPDVHPALDLSQPLRLVGIRVTVRWTEAWVLDSSTGQRLSPQTLTQQVLVCHVEP